MQASFLKFCVWRALLIWPIRFTKCKKKIKKKCANENRINFITKMGITHEKHRYREKGLGLSCFRVCSLLPCGHLKGKGWPLGSCLWCLFWFYYLPIWYPGTGVVLDCIDSWSLLSFLLIMKACEVKGTNQCLVTTYTYNYDRFTFEEQGEVCYSTDNLLTRKQWK